MFRHGDDRVVHDLIVIGAGGHAACVANLVLLNGGSVTAFVDDKQAGKTVLGIPVVMCHDAYQRYPKHGYALGIGDNAIRKRVALQYKQRLPEAHFPVLVHASACIGVQSTLAEGTVIMPQVNIGPCSRLGAFCLVSACSTLGHDTVFHDYASAASGVALGGDVTVGECTAICTGVTVRNGINIGADSVVGMGSVVNCSIEAQAVAYGVPCRWVRQRCHGEPYLTPPAQDRTEDLVTSSR